VRDNEKTNKRLGLEQYHFRWFARWLHRLCIYTSPNQHNMRLHLKGSMKKLIKELSVLSLYYREGIVGAWVGFLLGILVGMWI
jgi:hypothetical protein